MLTNTEIGSRIYSARTLRGLTLDDIASKVGVAKSTIQRYEKGTISKIKLPVIESIAHSLSVNPNWIIGNTDDPSISSSTQVMLGLSEDETQLIGDYRSMNEQGRHAALTVVHGLASEDIYKKHDDSAELLGS